ncbi:MAG: hypothetical protein J1F32_00365 [Erysipelotrichales bacterium]|nr:hypothetical protein [Erysipelotrichales bacterium]
MKKYFVYLLKKNLLPLACLTLFCLIIYVLPITVENYYSWNNLYDTIIENHGYYGRLNLYYGNISVVLGMLSVFVPIFMFSYKMNRRSVDMHYSLPLSKTKILISHFLVGLILMFGAYTVAYFLGFITIAIKVDRLYLINYLWLYLGSLIPAFVAYSVTAFIFTRANTTADGIISVAGAMCFFPMLIGMICEIAYHFPNNISGFDFSWFFPFSMLVKVTTAFGNAITSGEVTKLFASSSNIYEYGADIAMLTGGILWTLLGGAATAGLILWEKKSKAENCGQVSESIFCYKSLIPAYTVMLIATALAADADITFIIVIGFAAFIATVIYRRTIKIGWKQTVILGVSIVGGIVLYAIPAFIANLLPEPVNQMIEMLTY